MSKKIHQLSLFIENRPRRLKSVCDTLSKAKINIVTLSLAETEQFGIVRLIVRDWQQAQNVLSDAGYAVKESDVAVVIVPDEPGALAGILAAIDEAGVNIEYMYAFSFVYRDKAVMVFRFTETDLAIDAIEKAGFNVLDSERGLELLDKWKSIAAQNSNQ